MALIANDIISNQGLIRRLNLSIPDRQEIAQVLAGRLMLHYMETSVKWVTCHPILSDAPFNLAAPGICGNTALLDFGDMSYLKLPPRKINVYDFRQFLEIIGRNNSNSFIFGHGVHTHYEGLSELVLNTSYWPTINGEIESKSKSRLTLISTALRKCYTEMLSEPVCIQGTYFLCEGSKTDEPVLKVYARGPFLDKTPFCGSNRFIKSMHIALREQFGSKHFVALGGVYTVKNILWKHNLIRNEWEAPISLPTKYCKVNNPDTMITIFSSSKELQPSNLKHPIKLNSSESVHSLSHHSASEKYPLDYEFNIEEEYEGYFCPATTLYRIDEPLQRNDFKP